MSRATADRASYRRAGDSRPPDYPARATLLLMDDPARNLAAERRRRLELAAELEARADREADDVERSERLRETAAELRGESLLGSAAPREGV
jgi:hypothetical protein